MDQRSNSFLETEKIGRLMRKYAVPCVISLVVAALYNIVDQIFIANADYLGSYVIVGRCADYILRDRADCLRVFIHADMASRAKRIVEQYGQRADAPKKRLRDKDKRRAAYYQFYTDMKWGDVLNYHIALDSGALGLDKCVELLAALG